MPGRLKNKVALITGGGSGIGRAIALRFAAEDAAVAVCGRTLTKLRETTEIIGSRGGKALAICCDVADSGQVGAMMTQVVEAFGRLNILVNNAGVRASIGTIEQLTEVEWQQTFDIDAKGSWLCAKHAIPQMRMAGGGSIIMMSSISAHVGQPKQGCYNAAKAAQELLMKCIAVDFAADQIRANSICPAWVRTEMNRDQLAKMEASPSEAFPPGLSYRDVLRLHPAGRIGEPEDIAAAAVYLASDESRWVTGSSLMIDGGYTCQ
jgi:NAD(P)-dependent dehydrogenase (short-subunit alcohol dehydrogenase family)